MALVHRGWDASIHGQSTGPLVDCGRRGWGLPKGWYPPIERSGETSTGDFALLNGGGISVLPWAKMLARP